MIKAISPFAFILVIIVSCTKNEKFHLKQERNDYAYEVFRKAKNEKDIDRKLELLNLANNKIISKVNSSYFPLTLICSHSRRSYHSYLHILIKCKHSVQLGSISSTVNHCLMFYLIEFGLLIVLR